MALEERAESQPAKILIVDDQPSKLLSYEAILAELGEALIKANSAEQALELLLKQEIAVLLVDVCMPGVDGFQLASIIRAHPRFEKTAIIFVSAIHLASGDLVRGYEMGAVDYVSVPVVPEILRAKVKVFIELFRKNRELERLNRELEARVAQRTAELECSMSRLRQSERVRSLALAAGQMGSWDWDLSNGQCVWDNGQCGIFGVDPKIFEVNPENVRPLIHPEDLEHVHRALAKVSKTAQPQQAEFRVRRSNGELRWCTGTAAASVDAAGPTVRMSGVTIDITERKAAEERQELLTREVDHRARNALAVVQSIVRLSHANRISDYIGIVEGRIRALARAHVLVSGSRWVGADLRRLVTEELAPYRNQHEGKISIVGPDVLLEPTLAQVLALAIHELSTNAAKYGALSVQSGQVALSWEATANELVLHWVETGGPVVNVPTSQGYGSKVIRAAIERQLGGSASLEWRPEGVRYTFSIPRHPGTEKSQAARGEAQTVTEVPLQPISLAGNRVLLVEDEGVVAMMMSDTLAEHGFAIIGPFARAREAMKIARENELDGAVLDVNLNGEMIYPVAEVLQDRGVPFIFVTGYDRNGIDPRFTRIPVLQKPIARQDLLAAFSLRRHPSSSMAILAP